MFTELNKITKVLTRDREERNGLVTIDQKIAWVESRSVNKREHTLIQNHSGREWKESESRFRHGHREIPYHLCVCVCGAKLEKHSASG